MTIARLYGTATLLQDGKVLIAGGGPDHPPDGASAVASADLYNPATGKFTRTGSMTAARTEAAAVLLPDGRVLIAGGYGCKNLRTCPDDLAIPPYGGALASAELYDPATGKFTGTGSMHEARDLPALVLSSDGRVLVFGGGSQSVEGYDSASGTFSSVGSLSNPYHSVDIAATLLPNGKVLVAGEAYDGSKEFLGAEVFDPGSGSSIPISIPFPEKRIGSVAPGLVVLANGRVLLQVFDWSSLSDVLMTYDPATGEVEQAATVSTPAGWDPSIVTPLADGRLLFAGGTIEQPIGASGGFEPAKYAGTYDPIEGFRMIGPMIQAQSDAMAVLLSDGSVLIAGGLGAGEGWNVLATAELLKT